MGDALRTHSAPEAGASLEPARTGVAGNVPARGLRLLTLAARAPEGGLLLGVDNLLPACEEHQGVVPVALGGVAIGGRLLKVELQLAREREQVTLSDAMPTGDEAWPVANGGAAEGVA